MDGPGNLSCMERAHSSVGEGAGVEAEAENDKEGTDDDSLEDLFGCIADEEEEEQWRVMQGPAGIATALEPGHVAFRAAFARIDSEKEKSAQQWHADARQACSLLGCGQSAEGELQTEQDIGTFTAGQEAGSWVEWLEHPGGGWRVSLSSAKASVERLKVDPTARFPLRDVVNLLYQAIQWSVASKNAVRDVAVPSCGRMCIVGDTHGQLEDVLWILFKHGEPSSADNVYIFNGDVADRGPDAVEILMVVIMYSLADPGSVYLNRGNHEDSFLTTVYGFRDECLQKYGRLGGRRVYELAQALFNSLALACVIDAGPGRRLFVVHAGLPRSGASLEDIRAVRFRREIPAPPQPGEDEIFFDSLWSDPQAADGVGPNLRGPHVRSFGPDITRAFLEKSELNLVIRSHAVPARGRGIEWHHGNRVLTVFSASNYVGTAGNMGGVVVVQRGKPIETFEHWAGSREELLKLEQRVKDAAGKLRIEAVRMMEKRRKRRSHVEGLEKIQLETLEHVKERVVVCKGELFEFWTARDESADLHVTPLVWTTGMRQFVGEELPWDWLQEKLEVVDPDSGLVPYTRFLQRFRVTQVYDDVSSLQSAKRARYSLAPGWQGVVVRRVFESLLRADLQLQDALAALDRNADGVVGTAELADIARDCGVKLSFEQCQAMLQSFAPEGCAREVKVFDLLDRLTTTFSASRRPAAVAGEEWVPKALGKIAQVLLADAREHIATANAKDQGTAQVSETQRGAAAAEPKPASSASAAAPAQPSAPPSETPAVAEKLAVWFRKSDTDCDGYLGTGELEAALAQLAPVLSAQGVASDEGARRAIIGYIGWRGTAKVNYMELLAAMASCQPGDKTALERRGEDLVEAVALAIYSNRAALLCALRGRFDPSHTGRVSPAQFAEGLAAVGAAALPRSASGTELPLSQLEALTAELSGFGAGKVEYEAFVRSFHIVEGLGWTCGRSVSFDGA